MACLEPAVRSLAPHELAAAEQTTSRVLEELREALGQHAAQVNEAAHSGAGAALAPAVADMLRTVTAAFGGWRTLVKDMSVALPAGLAFWVTGAMAARVAKSRGLRGSGQACETPITMIKTSECVLAKSMRWQ